MLVFTPLQNPPVLARPTSSLGLSFDDADVYFDSITQRAAHNLAAAHARVEAIERQRELYRQQQGLRYHLPGLGHFHQCHNVCRPHTNELESLRPTVQPRRAPMLSVQELEEAFELWQKQECRSHLLDAAARQRYAALARQREAQRQRALAEAAAREESIRVARIRAQQSRDQEILYALLSNLASQAYSTRTSAQLTTQEFTVPTVDPAHAAAAAPSVPIDRKGKGRAVDMESTSVMKKLTPVPTFPEVPTLKEELEGRIRVESDPDVQTSLMLLYSDLFDAREPSQPVAGPSGTKHVSFKIPVSGPSTSSTSSSSTTHSVNDVAMNAMPSALSPVAETEGAQDKAEETEVEGPSLHRTPALPPAVAAKLLKFYHARRARKLSLTEIKEVEDALRKLEDTFEFPNRLDFISHPLRSPASLEYTTNNAPVHAYEHALNQLLTRLDAVESNGDEEVRGRRREVVNEVEKALQLMERNIEESKERSRERERRASISSRASDGEATVTPYNMRAEVPNEDSAVRVEAADISQGLSSPEGEHQEVSPLLTTNAAEGIPESGVGIDSSAEFSTQIDSTIVESTDELEAAGSRNMAVPPFHAPHIESSPALPEDVVDVDVASNTIEENATHIADISTVIAAPEGISRVASTATDDTFFTANTETVPSSTTDDETFLTAGTSTPCEPMSRSSSSSSADTFLLSSTPLADEPSKRRRPSSGDEDELDIISEGELETAREDSDWSDVESRSDM